VSVLQVSLITVKIQNQSLNLIRKLFYIIVKNKIDFDPAAIRRNLFN